MPNHNLTTRPEVAKIKPTPGKTTMYSDLTIKADPDARGIRLAVGATTKTWVLSKRINGKVRSITLGSWPDLPTVFAARDKAKEKMMEVTTRTDAVSTGIHTLGDALESHIKRSNAPERTKGEYRAQVRNNMTELFEMKIEDITLDHLEEVVMRHKGMATRKHLAQIEIVDWREPKRREDDNAQRFDAMAEVSRHMAEVRAMREALEREPWLDEDGAMLQGEATTAEGWQFDLSAMAADTMPAAWPWRTAQHVRE